MYKRLVMALVATTFLLPFAAASAEPAGKRSGELPGQWVNTYWFNPLPLQGVVPEGFSPLEASLMPEDCGSCHTDVYKQWRESRHAHAMGDGVVAQLHEPWIDREGQIACQNCHAPLYEQKPFVHAGGEVIKNLLYDKNLRPQGVACAACHVRRQVRYGPPPNRLTDPDPPHNGFEVKPDFNRAEFCKHCHQFDKGQRKLNGKYLQNTYNEWKDSTFGRVNMPCAACHMPERHHTFKGIHDKDMVADALDILSYDDGNLLRLTITNERAGHYFPTYITPSVEVTGRVITLDGKTVEGTEKKYYIRRHTSLDLTTEYGDTRIPPGESFVAEFPYPEGYDEDYAFEVEIRVYPDAFYTRFYKAMLARKPAGADLEKIESAYQKTLESDFYIYRRRYPL